MYIGSAFDVLAGAMRQLFRTACAFVSSAGRTITSCMKSSYHQPLIVVATMCALTVAACSDGPLEPDGQFSDRTWAPQVSGTNLWLEDVDIVDAMTATAVGGGRTVLRTTDGGATWRTQVIASGGFPFALRGVSFLDRENGLIVGDNIYLTRDGGATWQLRLGGVLLLFAVSFVDVENAFAVGFGRFPVGRDNMFVSTSDGGVTWKKHRITSPSLLYDLSFPDAANGTVVGKVGTILRTTDGGASWERQVSGTDRVLFGVYFTDADNGTIVGERGIILHTDDGGATWHQRDSGTTKLLKAVHFTDLNNGVAVGEDGTILRTRDAGKTWMSERSDTQVRLLAVSLIDSGPGMIVGAEGTILRTAGEK